jgi:hypothetical protein
MNSEFAGYLAERDSSIRLTPHATRAPQAQAPSTRDMRGRAVATQRNEIHTQQTRRSPSAPATQPQTAARQAASQNDMQRRADAVRARAAAAGRLREELAARAMHEASMREECASNIERSRELASQQQRALAHQEQLQECAITAEQTEELARLQGEARNHSNELAHLRREAEELHDLRQLTAQPTRATEATPGGDQTEGDTQASARGRTATDTRESLADSLRRRRLQLDTLTDISKRRRHLESLRAPTAVDNEDGQAPGRAHSGHGARDLGAGPAARPAQDADNSPRQKAPRKRGSRGARGRQGPESAGHRPEHANLSRQQRREANAAITAEESEEAVADDEVHQEDDGLSRRQRRKRHGSVNRHERARHNAAKRRQEDNDGS